MQSRADVHGPDSQDARGRRGSLVAGQDAANDSGVIRLSSEAQVCYRRRTLGGGGYSYLFQKGLSNPIGACSAGGPSWDDGFGEAAWREAAWVRGSTTHG